MNHLHDVNVLPDDVLPDAHPVETDDYQSKDRDVILVYGKTGMGKSRWTRALTTRRSMTRVMYMDPLNEYPSAKAFDRLADMVSYARMHKVFRIRTLNSMDFPMLCRLCYAAGDCLCVIEESQRVLPARGQLPEEFEDLVYRGRHRNVSIILVAQRPTSVHIAARSQWTRLISFRITEPADCDWIENQVGESLDLPGLEELEYYDISPSHIERSKLEEREGIKRM